MKWEVELAGVGMSNATPRMYLRIGECWPFLRVRSTADSLGRVDYEAAIVKA